MGFLALFFFPLIFASTAYSFCPITTCTSTNTTYVRFPFRIKHQQPKNCSYPGFDLYCTDHGFTALILPQSGEFLVRYISYQSQSIRLYDPGNCIPQRLLDGLDPSGSPFKVDSYVNYTFLSCPRNVTTNARLPIIDCLSDSTTSVIATSQSTFAQKMPKSCQMIRTLSVPNPGLQNDEGFASTLSDDIWLSWDAPDCRQCEVKGGVCGFQNNDSQRIGCFYSTPYPEDMQQTGDGKGLTIFRIIAFSIIGPVIICAMAIGIYLCIIDRRDQTRIWANREQQQNAVMPQPQEAPMGLDQTTIDSYTKVELGESRRVPGLNDGSCPICLSDFKAKENLRCIPDCQHCFHADCIDEWLRMNGTCPLCRNSPAHHLDVQTN